MSRSCMTVLYVLCCKGLVILKTGYRVGGNFKGYEIFGRKIKGCEIFWQMSKGYEISLIICHNILANEKLH